MIGDGDIVPLTADDDGLHVPATDDPWWTETCWFGFFVPERRLMGYFYPWFRPNLGVQAGGVVIWDESSWLPWTSRYHDYQWHLRAPAGVDLRNGVLGGGLSVHCTEALRGFDLAYRNDDVDLDLHFAGIMDPHVVSRGEYPFTVATHLDQPGRVTGRLRLEGEEIPVDCFAMRDRSWGPRSDLKGTRVGYAYGTSDEETSFLAFSRHRRREDVLTTGYLLQEGVAAKVTEGTQTVERDDLGRPARVVIDGIDALGRPLEVEGWARNHLGLTAYPGMFTWCSLFEWEHGGRTAWGENQDVWDPARFRRFVHNRGLGTGS